MECTSSGSPHGLGQQPATAVQGRARPPRPLPLGLLLLLGLLAPVASLAQMHGSIVGEVRDAEGEALSKVEILLFRGPVPSDSERAREAAVSHSKTDEHGRFAMLRLPSGTYQLQARMPGFAQTGRTVRVKPGPPVVMKLKVFAGLDEVIVVTSEPAELAAVPEEDSEALSADELMQIPAAADPWTSTAAASTSAVATTSKAEGSPQREGRPQVDGVPLGVGTVSSTPLVPELSELDRIEIISGVSDVDAGGSGAGLPGLNMVTRAAPQSYHGGLGTSMISSDWQPSASSGEGGAERLQPANRITSLTGINADLGGPVLKDHLWGFVSYRQRDIEERAFGGLEEEARLRNGLLRLDARWLPGLSTVGAFHHGERSSSGAGAGPDRLEEATSDEDEPSQLFKLQQVALLGTRVQLDASYSRLRHGLVRSPFGGPNADIVLGADGLWEGSYSARRALEDSDLLSLETRLETRPRQRVHELRFGSTLRSTTSADSEVWGTDSLVFVDGANLGLPYDLARLLRPANTNVSLDAFSLWVQDSARRGPVRFETGLRYSRQRGRNLAASTAANPLAPDLLPAVDFAGDNGDFVWASVLPRLGLTWAPGNNGRTLVRAGYSAFDSLLYPELISRRSPTSGGEVSVGFVDLDFDRRLDPSESRQIIDIRGVTPDDPYLGTPNSTDPYLRPERTDEVHLGIEKQVGTTWSLTLDYVQRHRTQILEERRLIRDSFGMVRPALAVDYVAGDPYRGVLPNGEAFEVPIYQLKEGLQFTGGSQLTNGDRSQDYESLTLGFQRRLSGRFSLRGKVSWNDWRWSLGHQFRRFDDPTNAAPQGDPIVGEDSDGDVVIRSALTDGSGQSLFLNSRWSYDLLAFYRAAPYQPWGFNVALHLHGRQGFPVPYAVEVPSPDQTLRLVQVTPTSDAFRLEDVFHVNLRLEKELAIWGGRVNLSLDAYNLFDEDPVLDRERRLNSPRADAVEEVLSPRTLQLGLRFELR